MDREHAINRLRVWYGWHGYTEAETEVRNICRRLNTRQVREVLRLCREHSDRWPPSKRRARR